MLLQALAAKHLLGFDRPAELQTIVRKMLRVGGYSPNGRGKPSSEYLQRAVKENALDSINVAVDTCNAVSLQSGLPISVVDLDLSSGPWLLQVVQEPLEYVFNRAGQSIALAGLLCLHDAAGPCANPVKDAQRTKTSETTTRTLSVIWGPHSLASYTEQVSQKYQEVLAQHGARCEAVRIAESP